MLDLVPGEAIACGGLVLDVRFVPGHAPGHVAFVNHDARLGALGGDVLFQGSIGRTDLPGSMPNVTFARASSGEMHSLPDDMVVWPGHGGPTTIGAESGL